MRKALQNQLNGERKYRIIGVDDESGILDSLTVLFDNSEYEFEGVLDPVEAIERVKMEHFDLMLLDFMMTPLHGDEVVEEIRKFNKELYILLLTGHKDMAPPLETIKRLDIQGYCEKSDKFDQLLLLVESGIKSVKQMDEIKRINEELSESNERLERAYLDMVQTLRYTVEAKDTYTRGHSDRVSEYSVLIGEKLGLPEDQIKTLRIGGLFHDIGKIGIPDSILLKPDKLSDDEYSQIKNHPSIGAHILGSAEIFKDIIPIVKHHHERYDGKGYPNGLEGENIPEIARILGVADAYDAMSSNRCYRKALPQDVVRAEMVKGRGTQFDPNIADIMLDIIDEDKDYRLKQDDEYHRTIAVVSENNLYNTVNSLLNHSDYVVEHYTEISEALYKCERGDIGLLLLDNDMDGISLKAISEKLSHLETSLIVMCDNHNLQTVIDKEKIIIDDYIVKPLNSLQLNEMVHSVLN